MERLSKRLITNSHLAFMPNACLVRRQFQCGQ
jgi:hypothetical protein